MKRPTKITFNIVAKIGDKVLVKNYRRKNDQWEDGEVVGVTAYLNQDNRSTNINYEVLLDRRTWNRRGWENYIRITVGAEDILVKEKPKHAAKN